MILLPTCNKFSPYLFLEQQYYMVLPFSPMNQITTPHVNIIRNLGNILLDR